MGEEPWKLAHFLIPLHRVSRHPLTPNMPQQLLGNDGEDVLESLPTSSFIMTSSWSRAIGLTILCRRSRHRCCYLGEEAEEEGKRMRPARAPQKQSA